MSKTEPHQVQQNEGSRGWVSMCPMYNLLLNEQDHPWIIWILFSFIIGSQCHAGRIPWRFLSAQTFPNTSLVFLCGLLPLSEAACLASIVIDLHTTMYIVSTTWSRQRGLNSSYSRHALSVMHPGVKSVVWWSAAIPQVGRVVMV
jgi:hypothetical protein